jgi:F0F1-type ATP synthase assembly protein I
VLDGPVLDVMDDVVVCGTSGLEVAASIVPVALLEVVAALVLVALLDFLVDRVVGVVVLGAIVTMLGVPVAITSVAVRVACVFGRASSNQMHML